MADRLPYPKPTSPAATAVMLGNRKVDTRPEVTLRAALHARGFRFRKNFPVVTATRIVRADIVFPGRRLAVFVDGCFWHQCPTHGRPPQVNVDYWGPKLQRNIDRDRLTDRLLSDAGWSVLRVWEHVSVDEAVDMVARAAKSGAAELPPNA